MDVYINGLVLVTAIVACFIGESRSGAIIQACFLVMHALMVLSALKEKGNLSMANLLAILNLLILNCTQSKLEVVVAGCLALFAVSALFEARATNKVAKRLLEFSNVIALIVKVSQASLTFDVALLYPCCLLCGICCFLMTVLDRP